MFQFEYIIGKGGFGKVWKVQKKSTTGQHYALKEMAKAKVIAKRSEKSVMNERQILSRLKHGYALASSVVSSSTWSTPSRIARPCTWSWTF